MKKATILFMIFLVIFCFAGCSSEDTSSVSSETESPAESQMEQMILSSFDKNTRIADVINDSSFGDYGRLIFPADTGYYSGDTLEELRLTWYNNISPEIHCYSGLSDRQSRIFRYIQKDFFLHTGPTASMGYIHIKEVPKKYYSCAAALLHSVQAELCCEGHPLFSRTLSPHHSMYIERNPEHIYLRIHTSSMRHKIPDF